MVASNIEGHMEDKEFEHNLTIIGYVFGSCFTVLGTIAIYIKYSLRQKVASSSESEAFIGG